jgi:NAD(P)-dependent dehydrogenase (short-subunit alcohol dehydrogenase family)
MSSRQRFEGKVALITGGGSGIGEATALAFAAEGAAVVLLDRSGDAARAVAARLRRAVAVHGDVRLAADCERAVRAAVGEFGGLDTVFCNAGVFSPGTAESQTEEEWDLQIDVLLKGTFLTCKHAIPALRSRGGGSIILSGSNCSHIGCSGRFAYTAAKAAMPVLAKQISNDYFHSAGIRANCVSPGYVQTRMTEEIWRRQTQSPPGAPLPSAVVAGWQSPAAIAAAVLFLASDEAGDIAGVTLPVSRTALLRVAAPRMA